MSVRKIGLRWQIRVPTGHGQRIEQTLPRGATRADAQAFEALVRRQQIDLAIGRRQKHLISEAVARWVDTAAKGLKSWDKDLSYRVPVVLRYAGKTELPGIVDLADRIKQDGAENGLSAAAVNRYLAILRRVANLAERWGWTDLPLGRRIQLLPETGQRTEFLTAVQVEKLCRSTDPLTADMIRFAALTGLRRGELLALTPGQIRNKAVFLTSATKSGKPRAIPLPPEALAIARKRLPWGVGAPLLRKRFVEARSAAGMKGFRWHDLRHTYASWLVQDGTSMGAVRDLLGHSSSAVTDKYAHLAPTHLRDAIKGLPNLSGKRPGKGKKRKAA